MSIPTVKNLFQCENSVKQIFLKSEIMNNFSAFFCFSL